MKKPARRTNSPYGLSAGKGTITALGSVVNVFRRQVATDLLDSLLRRGRTAGATLNRDQRTKESATNFRFEANSRFKGFLELNSNQNWG